MGTTYSTWLHIGFELKWSAFDPIRTIPPEVGHAEPRFDSKTGKSIKPEHVVTQEEESYLEINGNRKEDWIHDLCELLNEELDDVAAHPTASLV